MQFYGHQNRSFRLSQDDRHSSEKVYKKKQPRVINYRCYKNSNERIFRDELSQLIELINVDDINYKNFNDIFLKVLKSHDPMKQKTV